ncbi:MAG: LysR family transcriptional regulator [Clostridia bacterium]|nr:LysR family transcriptional regulator [Clostridia bacterium]
MELLQLRYFYESAKSENFSKTATMFMVPTTSVSASIKRLEAELGCKLFDRTSNRIYLNARGRLLQKTLCSVFRDIDDVVEKLSIHDEDTRTIKILVRGMRRKITDFITEYNANHPHIAFKTVFNYDDDYQTYDIIIDDEKNFYDGYDSIELFNMRLKLKCSSNNRLCKQKLFLHQLCNQPFVLMDFESNMHKVLEKACNRVGFSPNISVVCNDIECYEKFIAADMGIGIARQEESPSGASSSISDLDVADFNEHYTIYAYYSKKEYYGNIKNFIEFLKSKSI